MVNRVATWAIAIWTAFMAVGSFAAFLGIGGDCAGLTGSDGSACQADAWIRGGIGLALLVFLWFIVALPLALVWFLTRPNATVVVVGPAGQQVMLPEGEAKRRVEQPGWSYQEPGPGSTPA
jgi:hypothetical protein